MSWSVDDLQEELRRLGVQLTAQDGRLRLKGPKGAVSAELVAAIEANKPALLKGLVEPEAPPLVTEPTRLHRDARLRVGRREHTSIDQRAIAIIGMAGRFPGARNLQEFWSNVCGGVESVTFFSKDELRAAGLEEEHLHDPLYIGARGVMPDADCFDASFFGCTPREAQVLDPQHRVFLECAWEALEDAAYDPSRFDGLVGVYAGCGINAYLFQLPISDLLRTVGPLLMAISNDKDFVPTRASFKLNLRGPSYSVQAACSTSLVAVHLGCRSLQQHDCDLALAGGVQIVVPLNRGYQYMEGGMQSPDGHCRAFDARAQGTVFGDGVGLVVLKRLPEALADGDRIYAVIRGTAVNNDGSAKVGFTAPSADGQAAVIALAQAEAGVDPRTIGLIEAHGTATRLGDPLEVSALTRVMSEETSDRGYCGLSSVKTNIGHLDAAAGVAGLIKAALAVQHGVLPPTVNFTEPNPELRLDESPFYVVRELAEWKTNGTPRRAGVNAFGIGGTNSHVVLEQEPPREPSGPARPWKVLPLSAKTRGALEAVTARLLEHLRWHPDVELADVAYTLQVGRQGFDHRRVLVCRDVEDAVGGLAEGERLPSSVVASRQRPLAFLFPGQGAQHVGMAKELYALEPAFRVVVDDCCERLRAHLDGLDLRQVLFPAADAAEEAERLLVETAHTQPALFVIEYALAQLWMSWGFEPDGMIGHSIGEYVAACLADVFTLPDALALVAARGRMMQEMPAGSMLSVPLTEEELSRELGNELSLAAVNGPSLCVASGPTPAIDELERRLAARGQRCRRLRTSHAFHSAMMEPMLAAFSAKVGDVRPQPPRRPFVSNVSGTWIRSEEATDPGYWARHLRHTVRFADGVGTLLGEQSRVLLEVGPGRALGLLAREHAQGVGRQVVSSLGSPREDRSDLAMLLEAVGQLWLAGVDVDWRRIHAAERRHRVSLPTYPFERKRHWLGGAEDAAANRRLFARTGSQASAAREVPAALPPAAPGSPLSLVRSDDVGDWFYVPSWRRAPVAAPEALESQRRWLVFAGEASLGEKLLCRLAAEGAEVTRVEAGSGFEVLAPDRYRLRPASGEDYKKLLAELGRSDRLPQRVLHLWSLDAPEGRTELERVNTAEEHGLSSLVGLARALGGRTVSGGVRLEVVSNQVFEVTGEEKLCPEGALMIGPCKVIAAEYPSLTCRQIDIRPAEPATDAEQLLLDQLSTELASPPSDFTVAYRGRHRWTPAFERIQLPSSAVPAARLRPAGVYLITGGLGGIGLVLAEQLARETGARLILTSRSGLPPRKEWPARLKAPVDGDRVRARIERVHALEKLGAEVLVLAADVADKEAMGAAVAQGRRKFGRINGVIHAAGIAGGGIIHSRTAEQIRRVLAPKVQGTVILREILQDDDLDFLVLCSSWGSILGEPGQVDYCAANAFLDAFAHRWDGKDGRVVAINWGMWGEVGMAVETEVPAELQALRAEELRQGIHSAEGQEAFRRILGSRAPQVVVSTVDLGILHEAKNTTRQPVASVARSAPAATAAVTSAPASAPAAGMEAGGSRGRIEKIWRDLLGVEDIGTEDNFFDIGGSSILAIQVSDRVAREIGVNLPFAAFLGNSLGQLANQCDEILAQQTRA